MTTSDATTNRAMPSLASQDEVLRRDAPPVRNSDAQWIQYRVSLAGVFVFVLMMAAIWFFAEGLVEVPWSL